MGHSKTLVNPVIHSMKNDIVIKNSGYNIYRYEKNCNFLNFKNSSD